MRGATSPPRRDKVPSAAQPLPQPRQLLPGRSSHPGAESHCTGSRRAARHSHAPAPVWVTESAPGPSRIPSVAHGSPDPLQGRTPGSSTMVWASPALAAATLCLRASADLVRAAAAALILGAALCSAEHPHLGELVCDLEPSSLPASDPDILDKLKLCPELTGAQRDSLNALLLSGHTEHGDPSSWDFQTLQDLGPLALALNQTTLSLVSEAAREEFRSSIAAAYISQGRSQREKSLILLRALAAASAASHRRLRRSSARCDSEPITDSNITLAVLLLLPEELDLCLSSDVLIRNLEAVLEQPITTEISRVLKKKVDEFFPEGIPEEQLRRLGLLSRLYTGQEIGQWQVTTSDTLSALLSPSGGRWDDAQVQQLLRRYLALGGSLTGPLLREIGGERLCELREEQIQQIPAGAIGTAGQLNISPCSQTKKEQLYGKAREAFASLASTPGPYYCRIQPYLGGAPAEDLKDLANTSVINMDLDTFLALNPQELQKLSVTDVKLLLGKNLPELRRAEHEPLVPEPRERSRATTTNIQRLHQPAAAGAWNGIQAPLLPRARAGSHPGEHPAALSPPQHLPPSLQPRETALGCRCWKAETQEREENSSTFDANAGFGCFWLKEDRFLQPREAPQVLTSDLLPVVRALPRQEHGAQLFQGFPAHPIPQNLLASGKTRGFKSLVAQHRS